MRRLACVGRLSASKICSKERPDLARKFIEQLTRPESSRAQLDEMRTTNPNAYAAVSHLLEKGLPRVQARIPAITLDDTGTKHFSIKYGSGKGVFGIYPAGKLVAGSVANMVARYGEPLCAPTQKLRIIIADVGVLTSPRQCQAVLDGLEEVMSVIAGMETASSQSQRSKRAIG